METCEIARKWLLEAFGESFGSYLNDGPAATSLQALLAETRHDTAVEIVGEMRRKATQDNERDLATCIARMMRIE